MPTNREARQWTAALDSALLRKIAADRRAKGRAGGFIAGTSRLSAGLAGKEDAK